MSLPVKKEYRPPKGYEWAFMTDDKMTTFSAILLATGSIEKAGEAIGMSVEDARKAVATSPELAHAYATVQRNKAKRQHAKKAYPALMKAFTDPDAGYGMKLEIHKELAREFGYIQSKPLVQQQFNFGGGADAVIRQIQDAKKSG